MKIAAVILQGLIFAMTGLSTILIAGRASELRVVSFVAMLVSVLSIVALVRPFRRRAAIAVIALNGLFVALSVSALIGVVYYQIVYGGQPLMASVLVWLFAIPYVLTILAIWRGTKVIGNHAA
jgi:hypothetical protein